MSQAWRQRGRQVPPEICHSSSIGRGRTPVHCCPRSRYFSNGCDLPHPRSLRRSRGPVYLCTVQSRARRSWLHEETYECGHGQPQAGEQKERGREEIRRRRGLCGSLQGFGQGHCQGFEGCKDIDSRKFSTFVVLGIMLRLFLVSAALQQ